MADEQRGFAGFDALVSDLSDLPTPIVTTSALPHSEAAASEHNDRSVPPAQTAKSVSSEGGSSGKWVIALILIVIGIVSYSLITKDQQKPATPSYSTAYLPPVTPQTPPVPVLPPAPQIAQPKPVLPPELDEVLPPVGEGLTFSANQIRYCVSQSIRIDGARSAVDDTSQADINRFNAMIGDYNSRCSSFRYRKGVLESVQTEVEARRALLELEGASGYLSSKKSKPTPPAQPVKPKEQPSKPSPKKSSASGMPENAEVDYTGRSWVCRRGFHQVGQECVAISMPANAEIDYTGHAWTCRRGYFQSSGKCLPVQLPANAEVDYTGHAWTCQRGYRQAGDKCSPVQLPANAEIDYTGHAWTCQRGFYQANGECRPVKMPANAEIDYTGHAWTCQRGFYQANGECLRLNVPANGQLDYTGHNWVCMPGYQKVGGQCR